jgi:hypothetical protein
VLRRRARLVGFGQKLLGAEVCAGTETDQQRQNKALHPTAYSLRSFLASASGGG